MHSKTILRTSFKFEKIAEAFSIETPFVMIFDQHMWLKAAVPVRSKSLDIISRFVGLHLLTSQLMMEMAGVQVILETTCGSDAVHHQRKHFSQLARTSFTTVSI